MKASLLAAHAPGDALVDFCGYHRDVGTPESYRRTCADFERMGSAA